MYLVWVPLVMLVISVLATWVVWCIFVCFDIVTLDVWVVLVEYGYSSISFLFYRWLAT